MKKLRIPPAWVINDIEKNKKKKSPQEEQRINQEIEDELLWEEYVKDIKPLKKNEYTF